ncbi:hypothetical protein COOONC_00179 [Cooperia oncophora]
MPLLAIFSVITLSALTMACQDIDVLSHRGAVCSYTPTGAKRCSLETTEVMKFNSYNQEECLRLLTNQTTQKEVRFQLKGLRLKCVKEEVVFTRNTIQRVVDSKRCAHTGSCNGNKCASINMSSLLPELTQGNQYPGITKCIESCGGPGCGCFHLSSGCLFNRIFHMPIDAKVYEIFGCAQWKEEVELEVTTITRSAVRKRTVLVQPTVPISMSNMRLTITALTVPLTPALSSRFISDGSQLAIWNHKELPNPLCESWDDANSLINCTVASNCDCDPAETTVITAEIKTFVTAELLLHQRDKFDDTITVVTNSICTITNTVAKGCYLYPQGATAEVICHTYGNDIVATIQCEDRFFTIPCTRKGAESTLRFSHTSARIRQRCNVSCGNWVHTIHGSAAQIIAGGSNISDEIRLPDFGHIFDVLLHWYKTVLAVGIFLLLALLMGYMLLWTYGLKTVLSIARITLKTARGIMYITTFTMRSAWKIAFASTTGTDVIAKASPVPKPTSPAKPTQPAKSLNPPPKPVAPAVPKSRASGTILKELLQQGSRVLQLAASKVDQLAPAVTVASSEETIKHLRRLEKLLQAQQEQSVGALTEAKIEKIVSTAEAIETRISQIEKLVTETVAIPKVQEQSSAPTQWKDL